MKLTLKTILGVYDKTKDGKLFIIKQGKHAGKGYKKANVTYVETGEKIVSHSIWPGQKDLAIGDVFEGDIAEREYQGKKFYDFKPDKKEDKVMLEIEKIKFSLAKHDHYIKEVSEFLKTKFPKVTLPDINWNGNTPEEAEKYEKQKEEYNKENYPEYYEDVNGELNSIAEESIQ